MAALSAGRRRRRCFGAIALLALAACLPPSTAIAADPPVSPVSPVSKAARVEAAFLFNFAKFVEWPDSAFPAPESPLVIGILGDDPFGGALDDLARGELVRGRPLVVKRAARLADLKDCHILFVGKSESEHAAEVVRAVAGKPLLTVSDLDGFSQAGGMIQFFLDGSKLRFLINPAAAQAAELKLSAQLLSVGKLVDAAGKPAP
jgi:hypothetical protein